MVKEILLQQMVNQVNAPKDLTVILLLTYIGSGIMMAFLNYGAGNNLTGDLRRLMALSSGLMSAGCFNIVLFVYARNTNYGYKQKEIINFQAYDFLRNNNIFVALAVLCVGIYFFIKVKSQVTVSI